jgi:TRAP-type C4-dicarboxylate transport system substrate-binding protein
MTGKVVCRWIAALVVLASATVAAQTGLIRLGTVAPKTSPWITALNTMGQNWSTATQKRVVFRSFADMASESTVIDKMGTGGLESAALSVVGLAEIDEAFNVLAIPFFFESDAEFRYVLDKLTPMLSDALAKKNYHLVLWGHGGWVQIFSKKPIRSVADLQKAKLFTSEGSPKTEQWYRQNGFNPVPRPAGDIAVQLKLPTGAIDATPGVPPLALATQFYKDAPYMLDIRVAPLVAGVVITDKAWKGLSEDDRTKMLGAAKQTEQQLFADAPALDAKHIKEMQASGLQVIALDAKAAADFRTTADKLTATQRGSIIPTAVYDQAVRERDAYRKSNRGK